MDFTNVQNLCRVCLTKSSTIIPLEWPLNPEQLETPSFTIAETLEKVMCVKLVINEKYPSVICGMCRGLLKISYNLLIVFNNSQSALMNHFKEMPCKKEVETQVHPKEELTPVHLIYKNNKYSLSDVFIVEEEKEHNNFEGFLKNLGKEVSAAFVKDSYGCKKINGTSKDTEKTERKINIVNDVSLCNLKQPEVIKPGEDVPTSLDHNKKKLESHQEKYNPNKLCGDKSSSKSIQKEGNRAVLSCNSCSTIGPSLENRKTTRKKCDGYLCHICGAVLQTPSNARYHAMAHSEPRYVCHVCGKKYHTKGNLKWHINNHQNIRDQLCTICGKTFNYQNALEYHMRSHRNEKKYCCTQCPKRYFMPNSLKRHIRTHSGERPYVCGFCGKSFFSLGEKKKHEMLHTGQHPYKCLYCDKKFTTTFNRQVHHMAHRGPHECDYCSRTFIDVTFLKKHIVSKHPDVLRT